MIYNAFILIPLLILRLNQKFIAEAFFFVFLNNKVQMDIARVVVSMDTPNEIVPRIEPKLQNVSRRTIARQVKNVINDNK